MTTQSLAAEPRKILGRKVKNLRSQGFVPGNVFGKDIKSVAVQLKADEFKKVFGEAGETGIVELTVDKKKNPVLIANVQSHPVTGDTLHVDFRQVDLSQKITATVPVEITGESPAEKSGVGTVVQQVMELEVEALPADLPENFEVDVTGLAEVEAAIYVKDLKYDKSKIAIDAEEDQIVVKVEPPQEEKVEEPVVAEGEEGGAVEGEASPAEGDAATGPQEEKAEV